MMKITVLYGRPADAGVFEDYYTRTHIPIAARIPGVARKEFTRFLAGPDGSRPAYYRMVELYFASEAHLHAALGSPEVQAAIADIPNFATGGATVLVGAVQG